MRKLFSFDVETGGVNPDVNEMLQLAFRVEFDGIVQEKKVMFMKPSNMDNVEPEALEVTGITLEQIEKFVPQHQVFREFNGLLDKYINKYDKIDKFTVLGYNVDFDMRFLRSWFIRNGHKYFGSYFNNMCIDVFRDVDKWLYLSGIVLKDRKLSTVCEYFEISLKAHDAMEDIKATRKLAVRLHEELLKVDYGILGINQ